MADTLNEAIDTPSLGEANSADTLPSGAFVREAQWGDSPFAASYMTIEEAERIIQMCAEAYVETSQRDV